MNHTPHPRFTPRHRQRGISLIELMIGMLLGLLVVGAAGMIFVSNRQTYNTTETLGRVQENGRVAFEIMARDLREAGATACGNNLPIANVLKSPGDTFAWGDGLRGYGPTQAAALVSFGTNAGQRVQGTQAVELRSSAGSGVSVTKHNPASATIHISSGDHGFMSGDVLIICDYSQASIFEMTGPNSSGALHVVHNTGNSSAPSGGNFCKALSFPVNPACDDKPKDGKEYGSDAVIAKLNSAVWYIGHNSRGGRSLYRRVGGRAAEEITEGVHSMALSYYLPGADYLPAGTGTGFVPADRWGEISAIRIEAELVAAEGVLRGGEIAGTDRAALNRKLAHVVTLRGRNP